MKIKLKISKKLYEYYSSKGISLFLLECTAMTSINNAILNASIFMIF